MEAVKNVSIEGIVNALQKQNSLHPHHPPAIASVSMKGTETDVCNKQKSIEYIFAEV